MNRETTLLIAGNKTRTPARASSYLCVDCSAGDQRFAKDLAVAWSCEHANDRNVHAGRSVGETGSYGIGGASETALWALQGPRQADRLAQDGYFYAEQKLPKTLIGGAFHEGTLRNNSLCIRGASGIVRNRDAELESVGELGLQFGFPGTAPIAIAAAGIGENQEFAGVGMMRAAFVAPPAGNRPCGESWCVVRNADNDGAAVSDRVINAVRDSHTDGIGSEIVVINQAGRLSPTRSRIFEVADKLTFLGIDADDRHVPSTEALAQIGNVFKLKVAVSAGFDRDRLDVDSERVIHIV